MLFTYNIVLRVYYLLIYLVSFFNKKAALWIKGRKKQQVKMYKNSIWFHFASLGEFEQGRPVLEELRNRYPGRPIVITFFSPSGYEVRKNTNLAEAVYYLPLDTAKNARRFIETVQPGIAIFTKYEYWYHFFNQLHQRHIPLYIISAIFREQQIFFRWYGGLHRRILGMVSRFFVQDEESKQLLQHINITNVTVSGDTRFDRVWANAQQPLQRPAVADFKAGQKVFIAGSTWPKDEELIVKLIDLYPGWKFIIAPHEIGEARIDELIKLLAANKFIRFTQTDNYRDIASYKILIIDNIGKLSSVYQYGDVAYIGGGFGAGIHNTLEAAAFGLPVIFGPNYQKFKEARDLIELNAGTSIGNFDELKNAADLFMKDEAYRQASARIIKNYVAEHTGATEAIVGYITLNTSS